MSWDRIWTESEDGRGFIDRRDAQRLEHCEQFQADLERLYDSGNAVVLVAGKNLCFDELFLFRTVESARDFYHDGYRAWESLVGAGSEGCGFQEVTLYEQRKMVFRKSASPGCKRESSLASVSPRREEVLESYAENKEEWI